MPEIVICMAVFASVGFVAGIFARPGMGVLILTVIGAAFAGLAFLPDNPDVYQEMDPKNQALLAAIFFGVPAFLGWVAGGFLRFVRASSWLT